MAGGRLRGWGTPSAVFAAGLLDEVFGVPFERLRAADGTELVFAPRA
jgi:hypothetical protein